MAMVNIDDAEEGMTIIADVKNKQGSVLLKGGTTLTSDLIKGLKALKIPEVDVRHDDDHQDLGKLSSTAPDKPENPTKLVELERKFSDVRGNSIMEEIMAAVKEYLTEKRNQNGTG
jgi:hypothetical protein